MSESLWQVTKDIRENVKKIQGNRNEINIKKIRVNQLKTCITDINNAFRYTNDVNSSLDKIKKDLIDGLGCDYNISEAIGRIKENTSDYKINYSKAQLDREVKRLESEIEALESENKSLNYSQNVLNNKKLELEAKETIGGGV